MRIALLIILLMGVWNSALAESAVTDGECINEMREMSSYVGNNKSFIFGIKNSTTDFTPRLRIINERMNKAMNYMMKCMALHHVQNTTKAYETPYYPVLRKMVTVYSRLDYIEKNPTSADIQIDRIFDEAYKSLEKVLGVGK